MLQSFCLCLSSDSKSHVCHIQEVLFVEILYYKLPCCLLCSCSDSKSHVGDACYVQRRCEKKGSVADDVSAMFRLRESCLPRSGSVLFNYIFEELTLSHMLVGLVYNYIFLSNLM